MLRMSLVICPLLRVAEGRPTDLICQAIEFDVAAMKRSVATVNPVTGGGKVAKAMTIGLFG